MPGLPNQVRTPNMPARWRRNNDQIASTDNFLVASGGGLSQNSSGELSISLATGAPFTIASGLDLTVDANELAVSGSSLGIAFATGGVLHVNVDGIDLNYDTDEFDESAGVLGIKYGAGSVLYTTGGGGIDLNFNTDHFQATAGVLDLYIASSAVIYDTGSGLDVQFDTDEFEASSNVLGLNYAADSVLHTIAADGIDLNYDTDEFEQTAGVLGIKYGASAVLYTTGGGGIDLNYSATFFQQSAGVLEVKDIFLRNDTDDATTGKLTIGGECEIDGDLNHDGSNVGFFGAAPTTQTSVPDLAAWANISSGADSVDLSDLNTKVQAVHDKVNGLLDALQGLGLVGT